MKINVGQMVEAQKLGYEVDVVVNGEHYEFDNHYDGKENKQEFLNALCALIQMTRASGGKENNPLAEIRYQKCDDGDEYAMPIFQNGSGDPKEHYGMCPHGYYGVNIYGRSNIAVLMDVVEKFVREMW